MVIQTNIPALKAWRNLKTNSGRSAKRSERLSSGYRINTAADDAAGLAISEKMRAQIRGLTQAERNAQDGISLAQTADGGMGEVHNMLHRMRELSVYACNEGVLTGEDTQKIQDEIDQLKAEIDGVAERTEFNNIKVLAGGGLEMEVIGTTEIKEISSTVKSQVDVDVTGVFNTFLNNDNSVLSPLSVPLVDTNGNTVTGSDGNQIVVDFAFQKQSNGQVTITAAYDGSVLGTRTIGGGTAVTGQWSYGDSTSSSGNSLVQLNNGNIVVAGTQNNDIWSFTIDTNTGMQVGAPTQINSAYDNLNIVQPTSDGGYIVGGRWGGSGYGSYLRKLDGTGQFTIRLHSGRPNAANWAFEVRDLAVQTQPGGTGDAGYFALSYTQDQRATWITKISPTGGVLWDRSVPHTNNGQLGYGTLCVADQGRGNPYFIDEFNNTITMLDDLNYTGTGNVASRTWDLSALSAANGGVRFSKINALSDGDFLISGYDTAAGTTTVAKVSLIDNGASGTQAVANDTAAFVGVRPNRIVEKNGQILFVGTSGNSGWLARMDVTGNDLSFAWQDTFGNTGRSGANDVIILPDGNYAIIGYTTASGTDPNVISGDGSPSAGGSADAWFVTLSQGGTNQTIAGLDLVSMDLSDIVDDEFSLNFSASVVDFDPAQVIPGTQTGLVERITVQADYYEYEYEIRKENIYSIVNEQKSLWLQTGANAGQGFTVKLPDMHIEALGFPEGTPNVLSLTDAAASLDYIDDAASIVSTERAKMGAVQNRLEFTVSYLQNAAENLSASESRIRDADMAKEMMAFAQSNVLRQAGASMLAQANQLPEMVLQLLR